MPEMVPNYLTVDPTTGEVGAVFPGGIVMPAVEPNTDPGTTRAVTWIREADGSFVAQMSGVDSGGNGAGDTHALSLQAFWGANPVVPDSGAIISLIAAATGLGGASSIFINAFDGIGGAFAQLLESTGRSAFAFASRFGNPGASPLGPLLIAAGNAPFFFNGVATSNLLTITHNLGVTPTAMVFGAQNTAPASSQIVQARVTPAANTVTAQAVTASGAAIGPGTVNGSYIFIAQG